MAKHEKRRGFNPDPTSRDTLDPGRCGCGENRVLRYRKRDGKPFLGCSSFPRCRKACDAPDWVPWKDGLARREDEETEKRNKRKAHRDAPKPINEALRDLYDPQDERGAMPFKPCGEVVLLEESVPDVSKVIRDHLRESGHASATVHEKLEEDKAERDFDEEITERAAKIRAREMRKAARHNREDPVGVRDVFMISIAVWVLCHFAYGIIATWIGG